MRGFKISKGMKLQIADNLINNCPSLDYSVKTKKIPFHNYPLFILS